MIVSPTPLMPVTFQTFTVEFSRTTRCKLQCTIAAIVLGSRHHRDQCITKTNADRHAKRPGTSLPTKDVADTHSSVYAWRVSVNRKGMYIAHAQHSINQQYYCIFEAWPTVLLARQSSNSVPFLISYPTGSVYARILTPVYDEYGTPFQKIQWLNHVFWVSFNHG